MPQIRPYRADDWNSFIELDLETGLSSLPDDSSERERFCSTWPQLLKERFAWTNDGPSANGSHLLVLESDEGAYAGHLWLSEQSDAFSKKIKLWITTVALSSGFRGRGWGKLLMERALQEARARGIATVGLGVDARNAQARGLYEAMGFEVTRLTMEMEQHVGNSGD